VDIISKNKLEEAKSSIIELIVWYRDKYHKKDFGHTKMIENINQITKIEDLDQFEQILDLWLDND
jgi:hypothetical protein